MQRVDPVPRSAAPSKGCRCPTNYRGGVLPERVALDRSTTPRGVPGQERGTYRWYIERCRRLGSVLSFGPWIRAPLYLGTFTILSMIRARRGRCPEKWTQNARKVDIMCGKCYPGHEQIAADRAAICLLSPRFRAFSGGVGTPVQPRILKGDGIIIAERTRSAGDRRRARECGTQAEIRCRRCMGSSSSADDHDETVRRPGQETSSAMLVGRGNAIPACETVSAQLDPNRRAETDPGRPGNCESGVREFGLGLSPAEILADMERIEEGALIAIDSLHRVIDRIAITRQYALDVLEIE